ncbi:DUF1127 domain-containing protein [Phaeobacter porticola]|uniref:Putative small protein n=1 Tax=Phaeobacter porticola TaxID=1844006 RepID=A0A1L3I660_9RHOB|nr:hypothetical protein [Phaeobacter porticola]APG47557.1 putative small protein [Phaeobacter porticola]
MTYMDNSLCSSACSTPTPRRSVFAAIGQRLAIRRERRMLAQLDQSALNDMGISKDAADVESRRKIWDAPSNWSR